MNYITVKGREKRPDQSSPEGSVASYEATQHINPLVFQLSPADAPGLKLKQYPILGLNLQLLAKIQGVPNLSFQLHGDQQLQAHLGT